MEDPIDICVRSMNEIYGIIESLLKEVEGQNLARSDRESIGGIEINYQNFVGRVKRAGAIDVEAAVQSAKGVAVHAQLLGMSMSKRSDYPANIIELAKRLQNAASKLAERIDNDPEFSLPYKLSIGPIEGSLTEGEASSGVAEKK